MLQSSFNKEKTREDSSELESTDDDANSKSYSSKSDSVSFKEINCISNSQINKPQLQNDQTLDKNSVYKTPIIPKQKSYSNSFNSKNNNQRKLCSKKLKKVSNTKTQLVREEHENKQEKYSKESTDEWFNAKMKKKYSELSNILVIINNSRGTYLDMATQKLSNMKNEVRFSGLYQQHKIHQKIMIDKQLDKEKRSSSLGNKMNIQNKKNSNEEENINLPIKKSKVTVKTLPNFDKLERSLSSNSIISSSGKDQLIVSTACKTDISKNLSLKDYLKFLKNDDNCSHFIKENVHADVIEYVSEKDKEYLNIKQLQKNFEKEDKQKRASEEKIKKENDSKRREKAKEWLAERLKIETMQLKKEKERKELEIRERLAKQEAIRNYKDQFKIKSHTQRKKNSKTVNNLDKNSHIENKYNAYGKHISSDSDANQDNDEFNFSQKIDNRNYKEPPNIPDIIKHSLENKNDVNPDNILDYVNDSYSQETKNESNKIFPNSFDEVDTSYEDEKTALSDDSQDNDKDSYKKKTNKRDFKEHQNYVNVNHTTQNEISADSAEAQDNFNDSFSKSYKHSLNFDEQKREVFQHEITLDSDDYPENDKVGYIKQTSNRSYKEPPNFESIFNSAYPNKISNRTNPDSSILNNDERNQKHKSSKNHSNLNTIAVHDSQDDQSTKSTDDSYKPYKSLSKSFSKENDELHCSYNNVTPDTVNRDGFQYNNFREKIQCEDEIDESIEKLKISISYARPPTGNGRCAK